MASVNRHSGNGRTKATAALGAGLAITASLIVAAAGSARTQAAPTNTAEPRISGTAIEGRGLRASRGTWAGSGPITYRYQWFRCDQNAANCAEILNETRTTYRLATGDVGTRTRVRITASNASGTGTATSNATAVVRAAAVSGAPKLTKPPVISGTLAANETLHSTAGEWTGAQPITFAFQWFRCDAQGNNCLTLPDAADDAYGVRDGDIGHALRVRVTARNAEGGTSAFSAPSGVVQPAAGPVGAIKLPNGETSVPVTSVPASGRLLIERVEFSPTVVRSRAQQIAIRIRVKDTRGFAVRDALVFVRSTPVVTSTPDVSGTGTDGWITYTMQPKPNFPIRRGYHVQFFVKAFRTGDPPLAGIAGYRLVQVATRP
jgi:hypothetical protein